MTWVLLEPQDENKQIATPIVMSSCFIQIFFEVNDDFSQKENTLFDESILRNIRYKSILLCKELFSFAPYKIG